MSTIRIPGRTIPVKRMLDNRTWSAFAVGAIIIAIAPALVVSQTGRANEPWNDAWAEPWPALLDRPAAVQPELAALQQRIDASLEQLIKSGVEVPPVEPLQTLSRTQITGWGP